MHIKGEVRIFDGYLVNSAEIWGYSFIIKLVGFIIAWGIVGLLIGIVRSQDHVFGKKILFFPHVVVVVLLVAVIYFIFYYMGKRRLKRDVSKTAIYQPLYGVSKKLTEGTRTYHSVPISFYESDFLIQGLPSRIPYLKLEKFSLISFGKGTTKKGKVNCEFVFRNNNIQSQYEEHLPFTIEESDYQELKETLIKHHVNVMPDVVV